MVVISKRLEHYIKFSAIQEFVNDLCKVYSDGNLQAYKYLMDDVNILTETSDFVNFFEEALDSKHRARYCEGAYVDIPNFLLKNDKNSEKIQDFLKYIKKIYEDPTICPEYVFFNRYSKELLKIDIFKNCVDSKESAEKALNGIKPNVEQARKEFKDKNLDGNKFFKIMLIIINDSVETIETDAEEKKSIKNIINIIVNNPNNVFSKKLEIMKELMSIKSMKNIPFNSLINCGNGP